MLGRDASRAREQIEAFAAECGLAIVGTYVENESGAKLTRPELFRLIADSKPGNVVLIEQVDRLSRLTAADWQKLRAELEAKQIRVVALDLPTSWQMLDMIFWLCRTPARPHKAGFVFLAACRTGYCG